MTDREPLIRGVGYVAASLAVGVGGPGPAMVTGRFLEAGGRRDQGHRSPAGALPSHSSSFFPCTSDPWGEVADYSGQ